MTLDSCGSDYDTWLRVYDEDKTTELASCDDCGDCGVQTILDAGLMEPGTYELLVEGFSSSSGSHTVLMTCDEMTISCEETVTGSTTDNANTHGNTADWSFIFGDLD